MSGVLYSCVFTDAMQQEKLRIPMEEPGVFVLYIAFGVVKARVPPFHNHRWRSLWIVLISDCINQGFCGAGYVISSCNQYQYLIQ